jgi:hypothetical protein
MVLMSGGVVGGMVASAVSSRGIHYCLLVSDWGLGVEVTRRPRPARARVLARLA